MISWCAGTSTTITPLLLRDYFISTFKYRLSAEHFVCFTLLKEVVFLNMS